MQLTEIGSPVGLAIAGAGAAVLDFEQQPFGTLQIEGYEVRFGFVEVDPPDFDAVGIHAGSVLVRVRAFSCNYRDKGLILRMSVTPSERGCYLIGSEFSARVEAVGSEVSGFVPGDRVMIDGCFGTEVKPWGLPTNHASRSLQVVPTTKLMRIPDEMSDEEAAAFPIGAQTSFSMVRRAGVGEGSRVLVTAGTSNTSIFLIQAALFAGAQVSVTTSSESAIDRLTELGAHRVFIVDPSGSSFADQDGISEFAKESGGFDAVLDPYFDLYLERSLPILGSFGTYVTCGLERQFPSRELMEAGFTSQPVLHDQILTAGLSRNISIVANCLGTSSDLEHAAKAYVKGRIRVPLDSVMGDANAADFLRRTYCDRDRFGKVVFRYG